MFRTENKILLAICRTKSSINSYIYYKDSKTRFNYKIYLCYFGCTIKINTSNKDQINTVIPSPKTLRFS